MLILGRYAGQSLIIRTPEGRQINIATLGICTKKDNSFVKIGIEAPDDYTIIREELLLRDGASFSRRSNQPG